MFPPAPCLLALLIALKDFLGLKRLPVGAEAGQGLCPHYCCHARDFGPLCASVVPSFYLRLSHHLSLLDDLDVQTQRYYW